MSAPLDSAQFEELYRSTARDVHGYLHRRTGGEAEDLLAETFAVAWRRRRELPAPPLRRAWLFGVARTLLTAHRRHVGTDTTLLADLVAQHRTGGPGIGGGSPSESTRAVREALTRLSESDQEILALSGWEQLTSTEIALALGIRPGTARVRLYRARRALAADPAIADLLERARISAPGTG